MADPTAPSARLATALAERYRIEHRLGEGGMATVYLAEDLKHHRKVALKVLKPELAAALGHERFLNEINVTANLQHPHILPLFDSGETDGFVYYVMPYVEGESLRDLMTRKGKLPIDEALAITADVAAGLTDAHAHGIVHRDIKPENILVRDGEGLVADFGIALAISLAGKERLTATGLSLGTPAYMSPEQLSGDRTIDGRSDVYSLGSVLFEALTGEPPFTGPTVQAVVTKTLVEPPRSARSLRAELTPEIDAALLRALSKHPEERFETPRAFVEACGPPPTQPAMRRWYAVGAAAIVLVAAGVAFSLWQSAQTAKARTRLPEIALLAERARYVEAYDLAVRAERHLSSDSTLAGLFTDISDLLTVETDPTGARVYAQRMSGGEQPRRADSVALGITPLRDVRLARADYLIVVQKEGYVPQERIASSAFNRSERAEDERRVRLQLELLPVDSVPPSMTAVPGGAYALVSPDLPLVLKAELHPYFIDRFEVPNEDYTEFVRSGGYAKASLPATFVDKTGLGAPRGWTSQQAPAGTDRHPVTGVSWYEASAFCASRGKRLPSLFEWEKAARDGIASHIGVVMPWGYMTTTALAERRANFSSASTVPVNSMPFGISPYGAHAMAGNVKEWLANRIGDGFGVAGGSWQDPPYLFSQVGSLAPATAAADLGFRCARTRGPALGSQGSESLNLDDRTPVYRPVDAATFAALLSHYRYDRHAAKPRHATVVETADWTRERVWLDGVGRDSILAYLYLPKRAMPPYQTLVYVPGSGAFFFKPAWQEVEEEMGAHIKGGRAVLVAVLNGMIERQEPTGFVRPPPQSVRFRDLMVLHATELRLAMDYLETRNDIDTKKLAYVGMSWGAGSRLVFAAVDPRFRSVVLIGAGIDERVQPTLPEAANFNFAPYIRPPKLMINGRHDEEHPWVSRALPLWNLLRQPKELVLIEGAGHHPPPEQRVPPINAFLDRTLGLVKAR